MAQLAPRPPLRLQWRSGLSLLTAVPGTDSLYGITAAGNLTACSAINGNTRWLTASSFRRQLSVSDHTLYGYQPGVGLVEVIDQGGSFTQRTLVVISDLNQQTPMSQPVRLGNRVHYVVNNRLVAVDAVNGGRLYDIGLNMEGPHSLFTYDGDLLVVSGAGRPSRWDSTVGGYRLVWDTGLAGTAELAERTALVVGGLIVVAEPSGLTAYEFVTGRLVWRRPGVGNLTLAATSSTLYAAGTQAGVWAMDPSTGTVKWDRQYLALVSHVNQVGLAVGDQHLWVGAVWESDHEPGGLWAMDLDDGAFAWQAAGVNLQVGYGLPLVMGGQIYTYGTAQPLSAMAPLAGAPSVLQAHLSQSPNPLRGAMSGFNPATVTVKLGVPASLSFVSWHERDARNAAVGPISYGPGTHTISYNAQWPRGWTDYNQFGRLVFDIQESTGLSYSQSLLIPVNTLPDIQHHWAKQQIELMLYHKLISGYPDLTFLPDNLITRAECSTIIAQTPGLESPSPGFHSKFTDIADHWARDYIMVLEERDFVGGFREPDGTYTFRPNLDMTRAQEAKLLVKAYAVPPAPAGFATRFTDIAGHWAEADIRALEAMGYVTGFREADGSYTYRPEQNLTRAELCTMVVRIRRLTR